MSSTQTVAADRAPQLALTALDTLWIQVTGTLCNLACRHCFITCGPKNDSHPMMSVPAVERAVLEGVDHGAREFYFTGGEPFMHPQIFELIEFTLNHGPLTILTNGVLLDQNSAIRLKGLFDEAPYSLDLRVSLDGIDARQNDPIRGRGTFARIIEGVRIVASVGLPVVLTVTEAEGGGSSADRDEFVRLVRSLGVTRPRVKFLSPFRIGREQRRDRGYRPDERLRADDLPGGGEHLQCATSRAVTARGWYPCPILIEVPESRMGDEIGAALRPIALEQGACYTCHVMGVSCRT